METSEEIIRRAENRAKENGCIPHSYALGVLSAKYDLLRIEYLQLIKKLENYESKQSKAGKSCK